MQQRYLLAAVLFSAALCVGLACVGDNGPGSSPSPSPTTSPTPGGGSPGPSPSSGPGSSPDPNASPTPSGDPVDGSPSPTPTATPGDPGDPGTNGLPNCAATEVMVSVSGACDFDGTGLGCCPDGFPLVTQDCFCVAEIDNPNPPSATPAPTAPPFTCPTGEVLVRVPEDCAVDETGWGCCPESSPSIDADCFCSEFQPPE